MSSPEQAPAVPPAPPAPGPAGPDGVAVVDKPGGVTSHDVVAQVRRLLGTRRVGHAGTLDPMATGVLVVGVGRATRLLGHLARTDKAYQARIRLGVTTTTDDAEGQPLERCDPGAVEAAVSDAALAAAVAALTGTISQVPPGVSAIKVGGRRAYARVRAGQTVELAPRQVTVHSLTVRRCGQAELQAEVVCSSGTYVRALARDLGAALGVGAHLSALRRVRVGPFDAPAPVGPELVLLGLAEVLGRCFPVTRVDLAAAREVRHGRPLPPTGLAGPVGVIGPAGEALALVCDRDGAARPLVVLAPA